MISEYHSEYQSHMVRLDLIFVGRRSRDADTRHRIRSEPRRKTRSPLLIKFSNVRVKKTDRSANGREGVPSSRENKRGFGRNSEPSMISETSSNRTVPLLFGCVAAARARGSEIPASRQDRLAVFFSLVHTIAARAAARKPEQTGFR